MENFADLTLSKTSSEHSSNINEGPAYFWVLQPPVGSNIQIVNTDLPALLIIHRQDRLVSGIVITPKARSHVSINKEVLQFFPFKSIYDLNSDHISLFLSHHSCQALGKSIDINSLRLQLRLHEKNDGIRHMRLDPKRIETVEGCKLAFSNVQANSKLPFLHIQSSSTSRNRESLELDHFFGLLQRQFINSGVIHIVVYYNDDSKELADNLISAIRSEALNSLKVNAPKITEKDHQPCGLTHVPLEYNPTLQEIMTEWIAGEQRLLQHPSFLQILKLEGIKLDQAYWKTWQRAFSDINKTVSPRTLRKNFFELEHSGLFHSAKTDITGMLKILFTRADPLFIKWALGVRWDKDSVKKEIANAERKWLFDESSQKNVNPLINICNQEFRNRGFQSFMDDVGQYAANLRGRCEKLLNRCRKSDEGQILISPLEHIILLHDKEQTESDQKKEIAETMEVLFKAELKDCANNGNSIQAVALVQRIKNGTLSKKRRTMLVLNDQIVLVKNLLVSETTGQVLRPNMIHKDYGNNGSKVLKFYKAFMLSTTAVSVVASSGGTNSVLELASHDGIVDYMITGGSIDDVLQEVELSRARMRTNQQRSEDELMPQYHQIKLQMGNDKLICKLAIGLMHESKHEHPRVAHCDHIITCGKSNLVWDPTLSASFCNVYMEQQQGRSYFIESQVSSTMGSLPFSECMEGTDLAEMAQKICSLYASTDPNSITHQYGATSRIRHSVIQEYVFGPQTLEQVKTNKFVPLQSATAIGGGEMSAATSVLSNTSIMSNTHSAFASKNRSPVREIIPTKMDNIFQSRNGGATCIGRNGSIMSSVRSRMSFANVLFQKRDPIRDSSAIQVVLYQTCRHFIDLVSLGVDLSRSPVTSNPTALIEAYMPSNVRPVKLSMDHRPLLDKLMRSGCFKDDYARKMFPKAVFTAVAEYFASVTSVVLPNQWSELVTMIHKDIKSRVGFANEVSLMVHKFMDFTKDAPDSDRNLNFRLYLILIYLVEYSRKTYSNQNAYPKEISTARQVLQGHSIITWESPMSTLLKGFANGTDRRPLLPLVNHLFADIIPSKAIAEMKCQSNAKQYGPKVASIRTLIASLDSMDRKVAKNVLATSNMQMDDIVTYIDACTHWYEWHLQCENSTAVPTSTTPLALNLKVPLHSSDSGTCALPHDTHHQCHTASPKRELWAKKLNETTQFSSTTLGQEEIDDLERLHSKVEKSPSAILQLPSDDQKFTFSFNAPLRQSGSTIFNFQETLPVDTHKIIDTVLSAIQVDSNCNKT